MAGIDSELKMREMAVGGNPQAAQQRYAQSKDFLDLLVAQKVSNDYASARNAMQAAAQPPAGTVKNQLDMSNAQVTKNEMMRSMMPGVGQKMARDQQAMQRRAMGIPTQPAPNIRMADGGIVGFDGRNGSFVDADELSLEAAGIDPDWYASTYREDAGEGAQPRPSVVHVPGVGTVPIPSARARELGRSSRETAGKQQSLKDIGEKLEEAYLSASVGDIPLFYAPGDREERLEELRKERVFRAGTPLGDRVPSRDVSEKKVVDPFNVKNMVGRLGEPEFRTQGIMRDAEPTDRQRFATALGLPLKDFEKKAPPPEKKGIFDNVDIGRLQAFLAGGAGQTSTAGALGGGLKGLMAEDQRREALASKEAIEAAKIASQRYGIEQDYNAAMAKIDADQRKMIFDAQTDLFKERFKASATAANEAMDRVQEDGAYQDAFIRLSAQYADDPATLRRELAAVAAEIATADAVTQSILRGTGGGLDFPDLGTDED